MEELIMVNAIIMASGFSNRMGKNKLLLPYEGKSIIEHIMDKVTKCNFNNIILVTNNNEIIDLAKKRGIDFVLNSHPEKGQSESIKLGIINSPEAAGYAFFTGDQPLMDIETIMFLMNRFNETKDSIIVPQYMKKKGTPVIFPKKLINELLALEGDVGGRKIINKHLEEVKYIEIKREYMLWDIDTEDDYNKLICKG
jgi:molybdenum cofactor cytidylyltransferase